MGVSTINSAAKTALLSLGGSAAVCLIGSLLVGMLLLSLIPIYLSNNSVDGYGEIYTIRGLTIKAIYANLTTNFVGGSLISLAGLSNLCTAIFKANHVKDFYACYATNFTVYGPSNNVDPSTVIRRRGLDDVAVYEIGDMKLLFWNTCSNKRALGRLFGSLLRTQNSSCVTRRASACKKFLTTPNAGDHFNQWVPFPSGYTQLVVANISVCAALSINRMYNVNPYYYGLVIGPYSNGTRSAPSPVDCEYSSIVTRSYLEGLVYNQANTANSSSCPFTIG